MDFTTWILSFATQAFAAGAVLLRLAALVLVILACIKYLRTPKKPES